MPPSIRITIISLCLLLVACARSTTGPGTVVELRCHGALRTADGQPRDLTLRLARRDGAWTAAFATARRWNAAVHRAEVVALAWDGSGGRFAGDVAVELLPDAWLPKDRRPRRVTLALQGDVADGKLSGEFLGGYAGSPVSGKVTGRTVELPAAGEDDRAGLLRTFLPAPDGKWRQATLRFATAGGSVERLDSADLALSEVDVTFADDALRGTLALAWPGDIPLPARLELAVVDEAIGGVLVQMDGTRLPVGGHLEYREDTRLANVPPPEDPLAPERLARIEAMAGRAGAPAVAAGFARGEHEMGGGRLPYGLFIPATLPGKRYPLVVFLHGKGQCGTDGKKHLQSPWTKRFALADVQDDHPCFVLAPQAAGSWGDPPPGAKEGTPRYTEMVLAVIDRLVRSQPIDKRRIYVTGLSLGGFGTCSLIAAAPDRFAAGAPICGAIADLAGELGDVPLWIFHGDADVTVPVGASRDMFKALRAEGRTPRYTEYHLVGHGSYKWTYTDPAFVEWLFAQGRWD